MNGEGRPKRIEQTGEQKNIQSALAYFVEQLDIPHLPEPVAKILFEMVVSNAVMHQDYNNDIVEQVCVNIEEGTYARLITLAKWMFQKGLVQRVFDIRNLPEKYAEDIFGDSPEYGIALSQAVPKNFLKDNLAELRAIGNKHAESGEPIMRGEGVFHVTNDNHALQILKEGGFSRYHANARTKTGTGPFELHVGLDGVFTTYGFVYASGSFQADKVRGSRTQVTDKQSVFVFDESELYRDTTVCLSSEIAAGTIYNRCTETYYDLIAKPFNREKIDPHVLLLNGILDVLDCVVRPQEAFDTDNLSGQEQVLAPEGLVPQMLIVSEDAGFFYDEAAAFWPESVQQMAIITMEQLHAAMDTVESWKKVRFSQQDIISTFVQYVKGGEIDLAQYKYTPDSDE